MFIVKPHSSISKSLLAFACAIATLSAVAADAGAVSVKPIPAFPASAKQVAVHGNLIYAAQPGPDGKGITILRVDPERNQTDVVFSASADFVIAGQPIGNWHSTPISARAGTIVFRTFTSVTDPATSILTGTSVTVAMSTDGSNPHIVATAVLKYLPGGELVKNCGASIIGSSVTTGGRVIVRFSNLPATASQDIQCPAAIGPKRTVTIRSYLAQGISRHLYTGSDLPQVDISPDGTKIAVAKSTSVRIIDTVSNRVKRISAPRGREVWLQDVGIGGATIINFVRRGNYGAREPQHLVLYPRFGSHKPPRVLKHGKGDIWARFCGSKIVQIEFATQVIKILDRRGRRLDSFPLRNARAVDATVACSSTRLFLKTGRAATERHLFVDLTAL